MRPYGTSAYWSFWLRYAPIWDTTTRAQMGLALKLSFAKTRPYGLHIDSIPYFTFESAKIELSKLR